MNDVDKMKSVGCLMAIFNFIVVYPMWLFLVFGILQTIQPPTWIWVLFFCYVPAQVVSPLVIGLAKTLIED